MDPAPVLIVDDEPDIRELLALTLERLNLKSEQAGNFAEAVDLLDKNHYALCLTDMRLPDGDGLDIVSHINRMDSAPPVAVITAHGSMDTAIEALKRGAFDFINKPIDLPQLQALVEAAIGLPQAVDPQLIEDDDSRLTGRSGAATALRARLIKVARSQAPVCIRGESGSGKEVCARLIHEHSARCNGPFIAVNCGAIPSELMESEFFGHKKGAFTGAVSDEPGLFMAANGGTLMLDEVADLPLAMQVKLLRAIQEKSVKAVGGSSETKVDVRIVSATHKDLEQLVADNEFRSDLYYRINVIDIAVPPLRERREDIALIAKQVLQRISEEQQVPEYALSDEALEKLQSHPFPGNIRELENTLERTVALCDESTTIRAEQLIFQSLKSNDAPAITLTASQGENAPVAEDGSIAFDPQHMSLDDYLAAVEKQHITAALEKCRWNKTETARFLGISFRSLRYRLKKLGLDD